MQRQMLLPTDSLFYAGLKECYQHTYMKIVPAQIIKLRQEKHIFSSFP